MQRLKHGEAADGEPTAGDLLSTKRSRRRPDSSSSQYGINVEGVDDVMLRLAKCCRAGAGRLYRRLHLARSGDHDPPRGLPERPRAGKDPDRFTRCPGTGRGGPPSAWRSTSTPGTATACSRTLSRSFAETGVNILEARCTVSDQMVRNRFVVEVPDTQALDGAVSRLRNVDGVFDAYRVTPSAA